MKKTQKQLVAGDKHYRAYVGPPQDYDIMGLTQIALLYHFNLREYHKLFDLGCGSLRAGRLLIPYLNKGNYYGCEPNKKILLTGLLKNIGLGQYFKKQPRFLFNDSFDFSKLKTNFDFIVAQSICSHTELTLTKHIASSVFNICNKQTLYFVTFVTPETMDNDMPINPQGNKWIYPHCVAYEKDLITKIHQEIGFNIYPLNWFHQRQKWFIACKDKKFLDQQVELAMKHALK